MMSTAATVAFAAQAGGAAEEVKKAEAAWVNALRKIDLMAADALLAPDLVYTHSNGLVETKAQYLAKLKTGEQKYANVEHSNMKVQMYGNTAVLTSTVRMTGATKGVPFDNTLRIVHVWVKQGPAWQLVAHQTTKVQ